MTAMISNGSHDFMNSCLDSNLDLLTYRSVNQSNSLPPPSVVSLLDFNIDEKRGGMPEGRAVTATSEECANFIIASSKLETKIVCPKTTKERENMRDSTQKYSEYFSKVSSEFDSNSLTDSIAKQFQRLIEQQKDLKQDFNVKDEEGLGNFINSAGMKLSPWKDSSYESDKENTNTIKADFAKHVNYDFCQNDNNVQELGNQDTKYMLAVGTDTAEMLSSKPMFISDYFMPYEKNNNNINFSANDGYNEAVNIISTNENGNFSIKPCNCATSGPCSCGNSDFKTISENSHFDDFAGINTSAVEITKNKEKCKNKSNKKQQSGSSKVFTLGSLSSMMGKTVIMGGGVKVSVAASKLIQDFDSRLSEENEQIVDNSAQKINSDKNTEVPSKKLEIKASKSSPKAGNSPRDKDLKAGTKVYTSAVGGAGRNERERNRVKQVNLGFDRLRQHVPQGRRNKKLSKVDTLRAAVDYIAQLRQLLQLDIITDDTAMTSHSMFGDVMDDVSNDEYCNIDIDQQESFTDNFQQPEITGFLSPQHLHENVQQLQYQQFPQIDQYQSFTNNLQTSQISSELLINPSVLVSQQLLPPPSPVIINQHPLLYNQSQILNNSMVHQQQTTQQLLELQLQQLQQQTGAATMNEIQTSTQHLSQVPPGQQCLLTELLETDTLPVTLPQLNSFQATSMSPNYRGQTRSSDIILNSFIPNNSTLPGQGLCSPGSNTIPSNLLGSGYEPLGAPKVSPGRKTPGSICYQPRIPINHVGRDGAASTATNQILMSIDQGVKEGEMNFDNGLMWME